MLPFVDKYVVWLKRRDFFHGIIKAMSMPPGDIDRIMGQDNAFFPPSDQGMIIDARMGNLVVHCYPQFHGREFHFWYSLYQIGATFKIGILLDRELAAAPILEGQGEIERLWPPALPDVQNRDGSTMYQWEFNVPHLYDSWSERETFVLGMRHCHFRMLRILRDGTS